jgi:hypothetical protein
LSYQLPLAVDVVSVSGDRKYCWKESYAWAGILSVLAGMSPSVLEEVFLFIPSYLFIVGRAEEEFFKL